METWDIRSKIMPFPTLQSLAAIKASFAVCSTLTMKRYIFKLAEEGDYNSWRLWRGENGMRREMETVMETMGLPKTTWCLVTPHVYSVARGMWRWYTTKCPFLDVDLDYVVNLFCPHFFTNRGVINETSVATVMIRDEGLSAEHRFQIAAFYLMEMDMLDLWRQMRPEERATVCSRRVSYWQQEHARLWASYLALIATGGDSSITMDCQFWKDNLKIAVKNKNVVAVEACWQKLAQADRDTLATYWILKLCNDIDYLHYVELDTEGEMSYRLEHLSDMLIFFLMQLKEEQKLVALEELERRDRLDALLKTLLEWHYGADFLEAVQLCWARFLHRSHNCCDLWFNLCNRVLHPNYLDRIPDCDCLGLLQVVWHLAPNHHRQHILKRMCWYPTLATSLTKDIIPAILGDMTVEDQKRLCFSTESNTGLFALVQCSIENNGDSLLRCLHLSQVEIQEHLRKELDYLEFPYTEGATWLIFEDLQGLANFVKFCLQFEDEDSREKQATGVVCRCSQNICLAVKSKEWSKVPEDWNCTSPVQFDKYRRDIYESIGWIFYVAFTHQSQLEMLNNYWDWFGCSPDEIKEMEKKFCGTITPVSSPNSS